ncbi:MAG: DinB family protein [Pyrinomonadaceae bacterium]|nr:DinB family protein [Pyrinomonadaceae bacterium]
MPDTIEEFINDAKVIINDAQKTFGELTGEQLNWKPSPESWGVGQCFDHLIVTNDLYMKEIQPVADGTHKNNLYSKIPFSADLTGRLLKKFVSPEFPRKIKTFSVFEAATSSISETIIEDFCTNQERFISLMEETKDLDTKTIKIPEPISPLVNIRLIDAFEVTILHEKRHFDQAKRVMQLENFPGSTSPGLETVGYGRRSE